MSMGRAEDIFKRVIENGLKELDDFIIARKSEELFLDFKRSADSGSGSKLHETDRDQLSRALSGFGNSEGGVIVWGIDCSKDKDSADVAHTKHPIQKVKRFVSWLEGAVSGCTVPPHDKVRHHAIVINDKDEGFVVTLIPKSNFAPHQVVTHGKYQGHYYIRAGSNFERTPHAVLAGMFGRRPQPHVFPMFIAGLAELVNEKIKIPVGFMIANDGPGVASDLFMNALVLSVPGNKCDLSFDPADSVHWLGQFSFGRKISMISKGDVRLAPGSEFQPFVMNLLIAPPFSADLEIQVICGCGQSPQYKFTLGNNALSLDKLYKEYLEKKASGSLTDDDKHEIVTKTINVPAEGLGPEAY